MLGTMQLSQKISAGVAGMCMVGALYLSNQGATEIKTSEALRTTAYYDSVKVPTICYGSTRGVKIGMIATEGECSQRFIKDVQSSQDDVKRYVTHKLTQEQYDALVSFTFNVGGANFKSSTLLKKINLGDCTGATKEFTRWSYAKGVKLNGLVKRREREAQAWATGCDKWEGNTKI